MKYLMRLTLGVCLLIGATFHVIAAMSASPMAVSVEKPPQKVLRNALAFVGVDAHGSVKFYGAKSAFVLPSRGTDRLWLIAMQAKNKEYCSFVNVTANSRSATDAGSFVGCLIYAVEFKDFNEDGNIDALYRIKTKSNVSDAWVDEEVLFLSREEGFCRAGIGWRFASSPAVIKCD
ncbi:MAG: hypothetical protein KGL90_11485 [Burkholderiales bacterium]|nr:hypothetical protein [Burkholderiales bacterium]